MDHKSRLTPPTVSTTEELERKLLEGLASEKRKMSRKAWIELREGILDRVTKNGRER